MVNSHPWKRLQVEPADYPVPNSLRLISVGVPHDADRHFLAIINPQREDVLLAWSEPGREVEPMRGCQADLRLAGNLLAINPDPAFPYHTFERQEDVPPLPIRRDSYLALIPGRPDVAEALVQTLHRRPFEVEGDG